MNCKYISARKLTAIIVLLFSVCLAVGLFFTVPKISYADEKADGNEWKSNIVIVNGWSYGNYNPEIHIFEAEAKYGTENIKFTVKNSDNEEVTDLARAEAGTYTVTAELEDGEDYDGVYEINSDGERVLKKIYGQLIIRKADNRWSQYPKVVSWEYGKYDKNINLVIAAPQFGTPVFTVRAPNGSIAVNSFTAPDGIVGGTTAGVLSASDAGVYTLSVKVDGGKNYESLSVTDIEFEIKKSENKWLLYPDLVQWQYGSFNKDTNLFLASVTDGRISFIVKESEDGKALTPEFTVTDGVIDSTDNGREAAEVLQGLQSGTYWLEASVSGQSQNSQSVEAAGKSFKVAEAVNGWRTLPSVFGWSFGGYEPDKNIITGEPCFGSAVFNISDENGESFTDSFTVTEGVIDDEAIASVLNGLHAGTYLLTATVQSDEGGNYNSLSAHISFKVTQAVNGWIDTPSMQSWVKGKYNPEINFVNAKAAFGEVEYIIYSATDESEIIYEVKGGEIICDKLSKAGNGYYTLKATVLGTDDYSGLEKTFALRIFPSAGLQWWAILLIVVGALGVVAIVLVILHLTGVLHLLSDKKLASMQKQMTVDATAAAVRANLAAKEVKAIAEKSEEVKALPEPEDKNKEQK